MSVSSRDMLAQLELRWTSADGAAIGGSLGAARLTAANGLYDRTRPVWALALRLPFSAGHAIEASGGGGFETVDTDDPLASYLTRGALELSLALRERLTLGLGVYGEVKENLLLENEEHAEGFYAEIAYKPTPRASILLRIDHRDEFATVYDARTVTWDGFVRLSLKL